MADALLARVYAAARRGDISDLTVRCVDPASGARGFEVNRAVVAAACGYFRTAHATGVGSRQPSSATATLHWAPELFECVLSCIYLGRFELDWGAFETELDGALEVVALSLFLDCDEGERLACAHVERLGLLTAETALAFWVRAHALGSAVARRAGCRAVGTFLARICSVSESDPSGPSPPSPLSRLSHAELVVLLGSDELSVRTEGLVARAVCAWWAANGRPSGARAGGLSGLGGLWELDALVRYPWRGMPARDRAPARGVWVLPDESQVLYFLDAAHDWSCTEPALASARGAGAICRVGGVTYAVGGSRAVERIVGGVWAPCEAAFLLGRREVACAVLGTRIFAVGGISGLRACEDVDVYDVDSGLKGRFFMLRSRRACCAAETSGALLVCGGIGSAGEILAHAELYVPTVGWRVAPAMLAPRALAAFATVGADVYVAGGIGAMGAAVRTAEYYDAGRARWVSLPPMPAARSECAGAEMGGAFYVLGGFEARGGSCKSERGSHGGQGGDESDGAGCGGYHAAETFFRLDLATLAWSTHRGPGGRALRACAATYGVDGASGVGA